MFPLVFCLVTTERCCEFTVLNNVASQQLHVTMGIPQGSVLGPTLFTLFTNDLPNSVTSGALYMYADDTIIYCIGDSADIAIAQLNKALNELCIWCLNNRLTPRPGKSEVMVLSRGIMMGPVAPVYIGESIPKLVTQTRLLGMKVDNKLSWLPHVLEVKKSFVTKLELLKRSKFLPRNILREFYSRVILPSVKYGLVLRGSCCNSDVLKSIEILHCRAARITFSLPKDMESRDVTEFDQWSTFFSYFKLEILKLFYKAYRQGLPHLLSIGLFGKRSGKYSLRGSDCLVVPGFNTRYMKDLFEYRGTVLWNTVSHNEQGMENLQLSDISTKDYFKNFQFDVVSVSTSRFRISDFVYK